MYRQRLQRALQLERNTPVDIQIGLQVYEGVSQVLRSRLWLILLQRPELAHPLQVGRRLSSPLAFNSLLFLRVSVPVAPLPLLARVRLFRMRTQCLTMPRRVTA